MEQKRISFEVAKAIKKAGYPQEWYDCEYYYTENGELKRGDDYEGNSIEDITYNQRNAISAPYALDVWLWLWREKKIAISINKFEREEWGVLTLFEVNPLFIEGNHLDPEGAVIAAIEYLVDHNLLK